MEVRLFPESSLNLIISGILSLLGVILGILIERRFHEREVRERLFKALFEEVKLNHSVVKKTKETYKGPEWTIFELSPLYTLGYQNIRMSGELAILSRDTLTLLEDTYEMIFAHNRQVAMIFNAPNGFMRDKGLKERIEKLEADLGQLKQNLKKELKFLKSMR